MHWLMSSALPCVRPLGCLCHACGASCGCRRTSPLSLSKSLLPDVTSSDPICLSTPICSHCRHHVSDVVSGAFLGTLVASVYVIRAIFRLELVVLSPLGAAELANGVGCATSDGCSSGAERGASLLHGPSGVRVYQDQSVV